MPVATTARTAAVPRIRPLTYPSERRSPKAAPEGAQQRFGYGQEICGRRARFVSYHLNQSRLCTGRCCSPSIPAFANRPIGRSSAISLSARSDSRSGCIAWPRRSAACGARVQASVWRSRLSSPRRAALRGATQRPSSSAGCAFACFTGSVRIRSGWHCSTSPSVAETQIEAGLAADNFPKRQHTVTRPAKQRLCALNQSMRTLHRWRCQDFRR
jgi:hypothetical protein